MCISSKRMDNEASRGQQLFYVLDKELVRKRLFDFWRGRAETSKQGNLCGGQSLLTTISPTIQIRLRPRVMGNQDQDASNDPVAAWRVQHLRFFWGMLWRRSQSVAVMGQAMMFARSVVRIVIGEIAVRTVFWLARAPVRNYLACYPLSKERFNHLIVLLATRVWGLGRKMVREFGGVSGTVEKFGFRCSFRVSEDE